MSIVPNKLHGNINAIVLDQGLVNDWIKDHRHSKDLGLKELAKIHNEDAMQLQNLSVIDDITNLLEGKSKAKWVVGKDIAYDKLKKKAGRLHSLGEAKRLFNGVDINNHHLL